MRCQNLEVGMSMTKKSIWANRVSESFLEVAFGGSRIQKVSAQVGPKKPGLDPNAPEKR